jgi:hypothetical protein
LNSTEKARIRHQSAKTPNPTNGFGVWRFGGLKNLKQLTYKRAFINIENRFQKGFYPILINFYLFFDFC